MSGLTKSELKKEMARHRVYNPEKDVFAIAVSTLIRERKEKLLALVKENFELSQRLLDIAQFGGIK